MALQVLNLSVDIDYAINGYNHPVSIVAFDDIDSIAEFVCEKLLGNDSYTAEDSDDDNDGSPQNNGFEKYDDGPLYIEPVKQSLVVLNPCSNCWATGLDQANKTCNGYFYIIAPPPEA